MSRSRRHGFTLVELLVVIGIIAVLVSLMMPAVEESRAAARRTQCQSNLHNLGVAYAHRNSQFENAMNPINPNQYPGMLMEYAEGSSALFICSEAFDEASYSGAEAEYVYHTEYWSQNQMAQVGNFELSSSGIWGVKFRDWGRCKKLQNPPSGGGWGDANSIADAWAGRLNDEAKIFRMEDGDNWDWCDLTSILTPLPDGQMKVEVIANWSGRAARIIGPTGAIELGAAWGTEAGDFSQNPLPGGGTHAEKQRFPGESFYVPSAVQISYGMNSRANRFMNDGNKILLIEYKWVVADVVGAGAMGAAWYPSDVRPRHHDTANVLYADGRVETVTASEVDPRVPEIHNRLWRPSREPEI